MKKKIHAREEREKEHFDQMAEEYDDVYGYNDTFTKYKIKRKVGDFIPLINRQLGKGSLKILEIGCGTGVYTAEIAKRPRSKIVAIDISKNIIKVARGNYGKRKNITFRVDNAHKLNLKASSVDAVCGFYVLHHLNPEATRKEILRVLKPGGLVYLYEPNILNPVVFAIKSSGFLKKLQGDSSDEWAVNPLTVSDFWKGFSPIEVETTEFVWPVGFIPFEVKLFADRLTSRLFPKIPLLNLIGGSVKICLKKN